MSEKLYYIEDERRALLYTFLEEILETSYMLSRSIDNKLRNLISNGSKGAQKCDILL